MPCNRFDLAFLAQYFQNKAKRECSLLPLSFTLAREHLTSCSDLSILQAPSLTRAWYNQDDRPLAPLPCVPPWKQPPKAPLQPVSSQSSCHRPTKCGQTAQPVVRRDNQAKRAVRCAQRPNLGREASQCPCRYCRTPLAGLPSQCMERDSVQHSSNCGQAAAGLLKCQFLANASPRRCREEPGVAGSHRAGKANKQLGACRTDERTDE